jgi:hypothetical protein
MKTFLIIFGIIILLWIIKKSINNAARKSLDWGIPVLLGTNIQDNSIFRQIMMDDINKRIANGATVTREGKEVASYFSVDGRNHIYHTASPHYQPKEVYSTTAKFGRNFELIIYIWITEGLTYDYPFEIKYL